MKISTSLSWKRSSKDSSAVVCHASWQRKRKGRWRVNSCLSQKEMYHVIYHTIYHVDHLGPMTSTSKQYKHLFIVVDGFSKFVWLYPIKTTNTKEVIAKLTTQQAFGNPQRIISDRGAVFTSNEFRVLYSRKYWTRQDPQECPEEMAKLKESIRLSY